MTIDPEITLLEIICETVPTLDREATHRIAHWMASWLIDESRKQGPAAARVTAFKIVSETIRHLTEDERAALVGSLNALLPRPAEPQRDRVFVPRYPALAKRRTRREKHCSKCGKTGHDKRSHRSQSREQLLEME